MAETELGPLINPNEAKRVEIWIDETTKAGAKQIGGGRLSETTLKPAILVPVPNPSIVSRLVGRRLVPKQRHPDAAGRRPSAAKALLSQRMHLISLAV